MLNCPSSVWKSGFGDRLERLGVLQRRVAALVDQVELDLEPGHRVVGVEARLAQHPREHVEAAAHLLAVPGAVGAGELLCLYLFAHGSHPRSARTRPPVSVRATRSSDDGGELAGPLERCPLARRAAGGEHARHARRSTGSRSPASSSAGRTSSTRASSTSRAGRRAPADRVHQRVGQAVAATPASARPAAGPCGARPRAHRAATAAARVSTRPRASSAISTASAGSVQTSADADLDRRVLGGEAGVEVEHAGVARRAVLHAARTPPRR